MPKIILLVLALIFVSGCKQQKEEISTPAQEQINEYNKQLQDCKEEAVPVTPPEETILPENREAAEAAAPHVRNFTPASDDIILGNPEAKVVIVEYFSPTCPHCAVYRHRIFPGIKSKYIDNGKIAYIKREFIGNKQDLDASILARCEGNISKYNDFMQVILEKQDSWAFSKNYREILTNIAALGGITPEKYSACLNDTKIIHTLMENTQLIAKEPRFIGTPAFFINGEHYTKPYTLEDLSEAINQAINLTDEPTKN